MTPELSYFLKINVAIALFYAFYRLFFYKDTFFYYRRTVLLCFFAVSILYPLLNIQGWIKSHEPMVAMADLYASTVLPEVTVRPAEDTTIHWQESITNYSMLIYYGVVLLLAARLLFQLGSIIRLHMRCPRSIIQGTQVHLLRKPTGPFSFFHWIFIHPDSHTDGEISEIMTHEETHARQFHSADVILSELMCIFCWINPFIWLMKREVRKNLEYMADHRVLETGHDSKSYQYHLLGLTHRKAAATLSNSFNVLPLKNRIKMMNKRRTKEIGRTKYLMFLPLAALLLIISNIETVARTTKELAKEMMGETPAQVLPQPESVKLPDLSTRTMAEAVQQNKKTAQQDKGKYPPPPPPPAPQKDGDQDDPVFEVVETPPEFPGGIKALLEYLGKSVKYPVKAQEKKIEGRVVVIFVVQKDGSVSNSKVVRSIEPSLDQEALRVVSEMPKWTPGKQRGKEVNVRYTLPIMFRLTGPKAPQTPKAEEIRKSDLSEVVVVGYGTQKDKTPQVVGVRVAEKMPAFPGGEAALFQYLAKNIKYPAIAQENNQQGKVLVQMVIGKDGNLSDIIVPVRGYPMLDAEAIRVVSNMPKWEPGMDKGEPVAVQYTLPIVFRLQ